MLEKADAKKQKKVEQVSKPSAAEAMNLFMQKMHQSKTEEPLPKPEPVKIEKKVSVPPPKSAPIKEVKQPVEPKEPSPKKKEKPTV